MKTIPCILNFVFKQKITFNLKKSVVLKLFRNNFMFFMLNPNPHCFISITKATACG
jgi:hypothetical protein